MSEKQREGQRKIRRKKRKGDGGKEGEKGGCNT